jgi:hypothetical protein
MPDQRRLLVSGHAGNGQASARQPGRDTDEIGCRVEYLGQHRTRDAQAFEQFLVPALRVDVEQHRARGVARVGAVSRAPTQAPQQETVDGAERELTGRGPRAHTGHVVEYPRELGRGKIRICQQPGASRDQWLQSVMAQLLAGIGGAPVLPDDGRGHRLAAATIPHQRGFTLVRDADAERCMTPLFESVDHLAQADEGALPDVFGVVLDPAITRKMLGEFALRECDGIACQIERDTARTGGALVEREQYLHAGSSPAPCGGMMFVIKTRTSGS